MYIGSWDFSSNDRIIGRNRKSRQKSLIVFLKLTQPLTVSTVQLLYTVKEKEENPERFLLLLLHGLRNPYTTSSLRTLKIMPRNLNVTAAAGVRSHDWLWKVFYHTVPYTSSRPLSQLRCDMCKFQIAEINPSCPYYFHLIQEPFLCYFVMN